ncbi:MAG: ABC transporter ATP-binding protein [Clostridiales bacterium]|jgi:spermidine/putrescine transport system ATP-binding protein|nr:ABC transporter ATP-binding protein [Clostridiales bacterium]
MEALLQLEGIEKRFGDTEVLEGINLTVGKGEFITLLGSSGCGKTTTLRIIAGLEVPDGGRVYLSGKDVTNLAPDKRDVNMVFQNYALFPHMNVAENIAYSLRLKKVSKADIKTTVKDALDLVQLPGYESRMPNELSGGQRQRVAIARAVVNKPKILLLDEPLGALDLQLRRQMQKELKRLQTALGITFIYITHDQEEALDMSDRIALMRNGHFEQIASAEEIYNRPKTTYAAQFVGGANIIKGTVKYLKSENAVIEVSGGEIEAKTRGAQIKEGDRVTAAIRGENLEINPASETYSGLAATVTDKSFSGGMLRITARLADNTEITCHRQGIDCQYAAGDNVKLALKDAGAVLVDLEGGI